MKTFLLSLLVLVACSSAAHAAVLVYSPNGSFETKPNLASAVVVAAGKTIVINSPQEVGDITIPSTTKLKVEKGGLITVNNGGTLAVKGPLDTGMYQVFGSGRVSGLASVNPVWFADTQAGNQQAFNAVAPNGTLELTTRRNVVSITVPVPMTIKGSGELKQAVSAIGSSILVLGADNITVDGITLSGPIAAGNTNHRNVAAIDCSGRSHILIKNCTISGKQNGIHCINNSTAVTDITIKNNTIRYTGYGIVIWPTAHPAITKAYGSQIVITGNDVRLQAGYDSASENIRGIRVSHCDNVSIKNNTSLGAQLSIETWCDARNRLARNIDISGNTVDTWLCLDNCDGGKVNENTVDYSLLPAIHAVSLAYGGKSGAVHGIEVVLTKNIMVHGNYVANQPCNGIYTGYSGDSPALPAVSSNMVIDKNIIYKCATANPSVAGLQLGLLRDSKISNNTVIECGTSVNGMAINCGGQVSIAANLLSPVTNLIFFNNILRNNYNGKYTFRLYGFKNVVIDGLISEHNAGNGLNIAESTSSKLVLKNSKIVNNSKFGIWHNAGIMREVVIENCDVSGNMSGATTYNGATADSKLGQYAVLRNNIGLSSAGDLPVSGTYNVGDTWEVSHSAFKKIKCTAAGTQGTLKNVFISTTNGSNVAFVNPLGALYLEEGQYITIDGVKGVKKIDKMDISVSDSNGFSLTRSTVYLSSPADASVSGAVVRYSNATVVLVP